MEMRSIAAADASGQFRIGDITINRLGYGAMRITGPGIWGPPSDRNAALATLRRLPEIGVNFIDTADSYGPDVSEELIREALHPYEGLLIATKGGLTRPGPSQWTPNGRPEYLIAQAKGSLKKLGVEQIDLWQLHRIDPHVLREEQFGAVRHLEENVAAAGLSLTPEEIGALDAAA
jgi:aryl-alcohol dehydrogenase-like predicted oxidoreductase